MSILIAFAAFSVVLIGVGEALSPGYASAANMLQLLKLSSFLGIVSIGQTLVIPAGGIDLSVAWVLTARPSRSRPSRGDRTRGF